MTCSERPDIDGLSGVEGQAARRARLDLEDQLLAVADGEDHGRGELFLGCDEADGGGQVLGAAVAMDGDLPAELHFRELRLGHEIGRASCREECRSRWSPYH